MVVTSQKTVRYIECCAGNYYGFAVSLAITDDRRLLVPGPNRTEGIGRAQEQQLRISQSVATRSKSTDVSHGREKR